MTTPANNTTFDTDTWDEKDIAPIDGSTLRITRTRTERTFRGFLEGKAVAEYLFVYHPIPGSTPPPPPATSATAADEKGDDKKDAHADKRHEGQMCSYNGVMYFKGKAQGYETDGGDGEIAFTCEGTWGKGGVMQAVGDWAVVQGSGKGSLANVTGGAGGYVSTGKTNQPCWFKLE